MADKRNTWTQPSSPPPPLFVGKAERNFVKQINDKTFLPPVRIYALVEYGGSDRVQQKYGFDNLYNISVHTHKRRLVEDQNLFARLGDFMQYDDMYFEIVDVFEPRYIFGQDSAFTNDETSMEVTLVGKQARRGLFNAD